VASEVALTLNDSYTQICHLIYAYTAAFYVTKHDEHDQNVQPQP